MATLFSVDLLGVFDDNEKGNLFLGGVAPPTGGSFTGCLGAILGGRGNVDDLKVGGTVGGAKCVFGFKVPPAGGNCSVSFDDLLLDEGRDRARNTLFFLVLVPLEGSCIVDDEALERSEEKLFEDIIFN